MTSNTSNPGHLHLPIQKRAIVGVDEHDQTIGKIAAAETPLTKVVQGPCLKRTCPEKTHRTCENWAKILEQVSFTMSLKDT